MSKDNIKPNYYKKLKNYEKEDITNTKDYYNFYENSKYLIENDITNFNLGFDKASKYQNRITSNAMFNYFNCNGFIGGGYCGIPTIRHSNRLNQYEPINIRSGRPIIKLEVLNKYRLCVHTIYIENYKGLHRDLEDANELNVYTFRKGRKTRGYNIYIKENIGHYKFRPRVYAGSILYNDKLLANNVIYAIRQLYYIGLTVNSIASIIKPLTKYKGLDNLGLTVNLTYPNKKKKFFGGL